MRTYAHVLARIFGVPLMVAPDKARLIARAVCARIGLGDGGAAGAPERSAVWRYDQDGNKRAPAFIAGGAIAIDQAASNQRGYLVAAGGIALLEINGTLVHKAMTAAPPSGFMTYDDIALQFEAAAIDPVIKAILLDIDSPGGEASDSLFATADLIARTAAVKPVWAVADETMASAAYLLASGASRIVMPPQGAVGSIGVIAMHVDESEFNKNEGLNVTLVYAGDRKADFSPDRPLSPEALATMTASVNATYDRFVAAVARGRSMAAQAVRDTQAAIYLTGADAKAAGLVDLIATPAQAVAALTQQISAGAAAAAPSPIVINPAAAAASTETPESEMSETTKPATAATATNAAPSPAAGSGTTIDQAYVDQVMEACTIAKAPLTAVSKYLQARTPIAQVRAELAAAAAGDSDRMTVEPTVKAPPGPDNHGWNPIIDRLNTEATANTRGFRRPAA